MKSFLSSVQNRYRQGIRWKTASLDPQVRSNLAEEIESTLAISGSDVPTAETEEDELRQITESLEKARDQLKKFEKTETFISLRIKSYKRALEERRDQLKQQSEKQGTKAEEPDETHALTDNFQDEHNALEDEENLKDDDSINEKDKNGWDMLQKDEESLEKVVETHKELMANIEYMRRHVHELEYKQSEIIRQREECREFLIAAHMADNNEGVFHDGNYASVAGQDVNNENDEPLSGTGTEMRRRKTEAQNQQQQEH